MTDLGPEWVPDGDGVPSRDAARLILFDGSGRVLLIRGHDTHDVNHTWWFTTGGGLEPGEDPAKGAVRETFEETGIRVDPGSLQGPVMHREGEFRFRNVTARQDEVFYVAHLDQVMPELDGRRLTDVETQTLDEFAWFTPEEVRELANTADIYPKALPDLLPAWSQKWDGRFVELGRDQGWGGAAKAE